MLIWTNAWPSERRTIINTDHIIGAEVVGDDEEHCIIKMSDGTNTHVERACFDRLLKLCGNEGDERAKS